MILIFDYFETIVHSKSMDFNRGLKCLWENAYKDKCSFEEIVLYGEELFQQMVALHKEGKEYAFVKEELPKYAEKFGGEAVSMTAEAEADFLMKCNEIENMPFVPEALHEFKRLGIPMYVLSNSAFTAEALSVILERLEIRKYFKKIWSSADFGQIKPSRDFFEMAIKNVLSEYPDAKREEVVFVGDTYGTDVIGARQAGLEVVWLNYKKESDAGDLAVYSVSNASELVGQVKRLLGRMEM